MGARGNQPSTCAQGVKAGDAFLMPGVVGAPSFGVIVLLHEKQGYAYGLLQNQTFIFIPLDVARRAVENVKTFEIRQ